MVADGNRAINYYSSNPGIRVNLTLNPEIRVAYSASPYVELPVSVSPPYLTTTSTGERLTPNMSSPDATPLNPMIETVTVIAIHPGARFDNWLLRSALVIQLQPGERREYVVTAWLEGLVEYGVSDTIEGAISDLVTSMGEYLESLQQREESLGESARKELAYLRRLVKRISSNN